VINSVCSARSTEAYELARRKIAAFINARSDREIAFTRNASEAINLVANAWGVTNLEAGDEVSHYEMFECKQSFSSVFR